MRDVKIGEIHVFRKNPAVIAEANIPSLQNIPAEYPVPHFPSDGAAAEGAGQKRELFLV